MKEKVYVAEQIVHSIELESDGKTEQELKDEALEKFYENNNDFKFEWVEETTAYVA